MEHKERKHALLSVSGSERWLNCTPSARLEEKEKDRPSSYANEGTLAHELADVELRYASKQISKKEWTKKKKLLEKSEYYSPEMDEEVEKYVDFVMQEYKDSLKKVPGSLLIVESRLDLSSYIEEGFGTCDAAIISDDLMHVIDFKYGKGVKVDATDNPQLKLYGLGSLHEQELSYDIHRVSLTVFQPRLDSVSTWVISADDLRKWAQDQVIPKASLAFEGKGKLVPGNHCQWCKVKARCPALAAENLKLAQYEFAEPEMLSDEELVDIYSRIPGFYDWAKSVSDYMLQEALEGKEWPDYKLVEGRSNRRWVLPDKAVEILKKEGFSTEEILNMQIKGIGEIEKLVGKKRFPDLVGDFVNKPPGKPTLVHQSDKRPAIGTEQAIEDFKT